MLSVHQIYLYLNSMTFDFMKPWIEMNFSYFCILCKIDLTAGPCPHGYTKLVGHVKNTTGPIKYYANKTKEECDKFCQSDLECVSFEYCYFSCDGVDGLITAPYANACIINHENFPHVERLHNFIMCSKGKKSIYCSWTRRI